MSANRSHGGSVLTGYLCPSISLKGASIAPLRRSTEQTLGPDSDQSLAEHLPKGAPGQLPLHTLWNESDDLHAPDREQETDVLVAPALRETTLSRATI
jgi:hypothetical protein